MEKALIAFPSIEGFKNVIYNVNRHAEFDGLDEEGNPITNKNNPRPTIEFTGTVKLHGTNAGVCSDGKELWAQSKKGIITVEKDNQGFAFFVETNKYLLLNIIDRVREEHVIPEDYHVAVYGEWCGGSIQKGVAINQLEKMFVIFKIKIRTSDEDENIWLNYDYQKLITPVLETHRIYFIQEFPTFKMSIDFNSPAESQNKLIELTMAVQEKCPVGDVLGVGGIGEGIVWTGHHEGQNYVFKVKGDKHSTSKVKKLAPVDIEKINSINEFVEYAVTENRLDQAFEEVFTVPGVEVSKKQIGKLIQWMMKDIAKEESDTLSENKLEPNDVARAVSAKTVGWFLENHPGA